MTDLQEQKSIRTTIWVSRILRWGLGALFISIGLFSFGQGTWPLLIVGAVLVITGFFKPRRCLEENCTLPHKS